ACFTRKLPESFLYTLPNSHFSGHHNLSSSGNHSRLVGTASLADTAQKTLATLGKCVCVCVCVCLCVGVCGCVCVCLCRRPMVTDLSAKAVRVHVPFTHRGARARVDT